MKKRITVRSIISRPPTEKQLKWFYREWAKLEIEHSLTNNRKTLIKTGESDYALSDSEEARPRVLQTQD